MKKLVVLTGAGISADSGLQTFRGSNGLWNGYNVYDVASPEGWAKDHKTVLEFYNLRRQEIAKAKPNEGHKTLAALEQYFDVTIITQNIDNLHESAGSSKVLHLHGEITKSQSTKDTMLVYDSGFKDINPGDSCELGSQLRPFIVWFGEAVPMIEEAARVCSRADLFMVVGTSLQVYPASGLLDYVPMQTPTWLVDPEMPSYYGAKEITHVADTAAKGLPKLLKQLQKFA